MQDLLAVTASTASSCGLRAPNTLVLWKVLNKCAYLEVLLTSGQGAGLLMAGTSWGLSIALGFKKKTGIMMNGEFLMATLLSSSSKYCSTIQTLDYSKHWHNYVIFPGSLVLFLGGLRSVCAVRGLVRPPCSCVNLSCVYCSWLGEAFLEYFGFLCILQESLM